MIGILLTGIMILLLSAGLQYAGLQFKDLPTSDQQTWRIIFLYVLPSIFIALSYWQGRKIKVFTRRAWMAEHPAEFSADKVDCYVRFIGRLAQEGASCRLPFSRSECVFYAASVIAEWQTKRKKPSKGMETHRKPIFTEYSSLEMALVGKEGGVHVRADDLRKDWLLLRTKESSQAHCPAEARAQAASKYKNYQLMERFLLPGDTVVAQGRLALNNDGRLFMKPTGRLEYPSFVTVQPEAGQVISGIVGKAKSSAWKRRMIVAALLINAGLFVHFWL